LRLFYGLASGGLMTKSIIIVGAGIIGAMAALECSHAGLDVTVVGDAALPRASDGSLVWLNASTVSDPAYAKLRGQSLVLWHQIKAKNADCPVEFPGTLLASGDGFGADKATAVDAALADELAPGMAHHSDMYFVAGEGRADPSAMMNWVHDQMKHAGITLVDQPVTAIAPGQVSLADGTNLGGDHIVLAAGGGTRALLAGAGYDLPVTAKPGVVYLTNPVPPLARPVMMTPDLDLWQRGDGRVLVASSLAKGTAADASVEAGRVLELLAQTFPGPAFQIEKTVQRDRPVPNDGFPLVGHVPGLDGVICAVTHSGMTLAPIIAQTVTALIEGRPHGMGAFVLDRSALTLA